MKIKSTEAFGIQRKIVANMTSESWETIPHVAVIRFAGGKAAMNCIISKPFIRGRR